MISRRTLLKSGLRCAAAAALAPQLACVSQRAIARPLWVNDVHSGLNRTPVAGVETPGSVEALVDAVRRARDGGRRLCLAGGRHAMGGQQFAHGAVMIDTRGVDRVLEFDRASGQVEVGAGIQWPELVESLRAQQADGGPAWGIVQKQTGADRLCLGGALAANAHGRGLALAPISGEVEAFSLVDAEGRLLRCSRDENPELFRLAIGGYGLFGAVASVRLRLSPRRQLERRVELVDLRDLPRRFEERIAEGCLYGDCQYETALDAEGGLRRGVLSCYRPVDRAEPIPENRRSLSDDDWRALIVLAHREPARAFQVYADYYLSTSGQRYWSDTHQLSTYIDDYHEKLAPRLGPLARGSEMISELYVPREAVADFLERVRGDFREHDVRLIYGTIRLIERDADSFLPWARERWACVIFNLHTAHDRPSLAKTARDFQRLIDRALEFDGSYFLTYHRWARRDQIEACHPRFAHFLREKRRFDPQERFTSEWYVHHRNLFGIG